MRIALRLAVIPFLVAGCMPEIASPSVPSTADPPTTAAPTAGVESSASPLPPAVPSADPSAVPIGDLDCDGGAVSGSFDYVAGVGGGPPDIGPATRALHGVLSTDEIVVAADRSGVVRDGRIVFTGWWIETTTGGWLLSTFNACESSGIGGG